jgi:hypothetical protein
LGNAIIAYLTEFKIIQAIVGPADIYKPWFEIPQFYKTHKWLPMINNEFVRDESRKQKLTSVNHFAMFRWREDRVVFPS